jgi:hypothetical protein
MDRQGLLGRDMDDKPERTLAQSDRLDELREEARYRRERLTLYQARL